MKTRSMLALSLVLCIALVAGGCASVDRARTFDGLKLSTAGENVFHINGRVSGLYFLPMFPLITGNTDNPGTIIPYFLTNTVSTQGMADMISRESRLAGATHVLDMQSSHQSIWIAPSLVFFWKSGTISANAVK